MIRPEEVTVKIKELQAQRKLNNYRLSKASGISMSALSHMFSKKTIPSVGTLIKLCDGLGITLNDLFEYETTERAYLTEDERELLELWESLDRSERRELLYYLEWRKLKDGMEIDAAKEY